MVHCGSYQLQKGTFMKKTDSDLESDVRDELDWDPVLDDSKITVKANDGKVTLSGTVPTYHQTVLAREDARSVNGVRSVDNELQIDPDSGILADTAIAVACASALDVDSLIPYGAVTADVSNGWVTLTGEVRYYYQRKEAESAVNRVNGVRGVTDKVEITNDPIPSDVADRITRAFRRDAIIDDSLITVTNSGHTVYLDGTTGSWYAMNEAVDTAWQAPGVSDVVNRLVVVP